MTHSTVSRSVWFTGPRTVELRERALPSCKDGEVQVRALCSGISHGSEMLVYRGEVPANAAVDLTIPTMQGSFAFPVKYGYASVGRITRLGLGVRDLNEGDLVFAFHPHETEYVIPAEFVLRLDPDVDPRNAIFLAALETALNAVLDAAPRIGERVAIIGQGVVGILITQLVRRLSPEVLVTCDLFEKRRSLSLELGADLSVDPAQTKLCSALGADDEERKTGLSTSGLDLVFEVSGKPEALTDAIDSVGREGRVVVVSWYGTRKSPVDLGNAFHRNRVTIRSSQVSNIDPGLAPRWTVARRRRLAIHYLKDLRLSELATHKFRFEEAAEAYRLIDRHSQDVVQVLLEY
jgi:2-desacetyl-2-hydroxyethyl bacteriochlorophyllide A dehydrogenase